MRTLKIVFDTHETPENIARRIVRAFDPGEVFLIKGKYFRVSGMRTANETTKENVQDDKYTLILNVGESAPEQKVEVAPTEVMLPPPGNPVVDPFNPGPLSSAPEQANDNPGPISNPPNSAIFHNPPEKRPSDSGEFLVTRPEASKVTREGPPVQVLAGQVWRPKDQRRSTTFTVAKVDEEYLYTDKGGRISLKRLRNYRLMGM